MKIIVESKKRKQSLIRVLKFLHDIRPAKGKFKNGKWFFEHGCKTDAGLTEYDLDALNDLVHLYLSDSHFLISVENK